MPKKILQPGQNTLQRVTTNRATPIKLQVRIVKQIGKKMAIKEENYF